MSALDRLGDLVEERILTTAKVGQKLADAVEAAIKTHKAAGGGNLSTAESLVRSLTKTVIAETLLRDGGRTGHKEAPEPVDSALVSAYAQVRAEALLADSRAVIVSGIPATPSMLNFLNCVDHLCDQVGDIDESQIRVALLKLAPAHKSMGTESNRAEVYTVTRRARLRSLLRKIVCQLSALDHAERPPAPDSTPAEQELPEAGCNEAVRGAVEGLARALYRLQWDMSRECGSGLPLRLDWDSPCLLQAPLSVRGQSSSSNVELASVLHIDGAGISSVCGHYTLVEHSRDQQCGEHLGSAGGGSTHHDPTRATSAIDPVRASWSIMYRQDQGAAQILRCAVNLSVPAPGIEFERWCIVDDAASRVLYTAVVPAGAPPPDYGWRPTSSDGWPPPELRVAPSPELVAGDDGLPCPGLVSDPVESPGDQQGFAVAMTASDLIADDAEDEPPVLVIDYRAQSYDDERVIHPTASPSAATGRPRPRSARIRDYRRSTSTGASSQDSVALVRKERRRCRSLELQAGGSGTSSGRQGVAGTGDNEDASVDGELPLSEVMEELRKWEAPAQGDWGPMPQFSGLESYLSTLEDQGGAKEGPARVRQDQLAALYEHQCGYLAEREAALRRQLQEASGQDGRAAASRVVQEFVSQAWDTLSQQQSSTGFGEGRGQGGEAPHELRFESLVASLWDKGLSKHVERVQEGEGGRGDEARATEAVAQELRAEPWEPDVPEERAVGEDGPVAEGGGCQDGTTGDTDPVQVEAEEAGSGLGVREANGYALVDLLGVNGEMGQVLSTIDIEVCGMEWEGLGRGGSGRTSPVIAASATGKTPQPLYLIRVTNVETEDQQPERHIDKTSGEGLAPCVPPPLLRHRIRVLRKPLSALSTLHEDLQAVLVAAESRFELPSPPFAHLKEFEATHARQVSDPFSFPSLSSATAKARASCMRQLQDYLQALLRLLVEEAQLQQEMSNVTRDTTGTVQSSLPSGDTSAMQAELLTELLGRVRCFFAAATGGSLGTQQDLVIGWTVDKEVDVNSALREDLFRSQGGRCRGCATVLSSSSFLGIGKDYMTCRYLGALFCTAVCYVDAPPAHIPTDVVHKWEFTRRKVCRYSARYLTAMASKPVVYAAHFTPSLLSGNSTIKYARQLRAQLRDLRVVADKSQCREAQAMLQPLADSRPHLMLVQEVFSLEDLVELQRGTLADALTTLVESLNDHVVEDCSVCRMRGCSTCKVCGHPEPLFPHQLWKVVACAQCGQVFHKACMRGQDLRHGCRLCCTEPTPLAHSAHRHDAEALNQPCSTEQGGASLGLARSNGIGVGHGGVRTSEAGAEAGGDGMEPDVDYSFSFDQTTNCNDL